MTSITQKHHERGGRDSAYGFIIKIVDVRQIFDQIHPLINCLSVCLFVVERNALNSRCVPGKCFSAGNECHLLQLKGITCVVDACIREFLNKRMLPRSSTRSKMAVYSPIIVIVVLHCTSLVSGHGRLVEPPSRSSMWRFGFKTKPNYNDNELFCGGYTVQWQRNGGKCGEIKSVVEITANHRGFFEFKLCPHNDPTTEVTQGCLDQFPLEIADGSGTKYYPSAKTGPFVVHLRLPYHLTCSQCVFQWTYTAGNNWGRCENGTAKVGCGPQETFRGCADVAIGDVETNDIPTYAAKPPGKKSISAIPPRPTTLRPRPTTLRPRPTTLRPRPTTLRPRYRPRPTRVSTQWTTSRRPSYKSRPVTTRKPYQRRPRPTRPQNYNVPSRSYTTRRPIFVSKPTTYRNIYTPRPTPWRPFDTKIHATKKPRPTYKAKVSPMKSNTNRETEDRIGGCKAVGVWASISGIASWCDTNCARGYCPSSHCDCS
ncbi:hypothetical protein AVEN_111652-1 [Araneus ventricosus]|uniref:Chitin-binding type-4 domain-containing protein n=1 Tax=Araneus ventricosus TaxID=182803 RepID=A0A4Y2C367_ARAVE|nr:hypothetical protein AVEN_111652-1 [Araneus ventricosus]